jgi:hypothetical protein
MNERDIPKKFKKLYERARSGKSRKAAIKFGCLECCGFERNEVALCSDPFCGYLPYRPYKTVKEALADAPDTQ